MTVLNTPLNRENSPISVLWSVIIFLAILIMGLAMLGGCTPAAQTEALADPSLADSPEVLAEVPDDTLAFYGFEDIPHDPIVELPVGPDGYAQLDDLEELHRTSMQLASEGSLGLSRDHLFVLQEQLSLPRPADTDSAYESHCRSLARRVGLLAAIMAEQEAFLGDPAFTDSLLAAGYGRLANYAFPDSLIPATGITLNAITADLLTNDNQAVRRWIEYFTGRGRRSFQHWLDRKAVVEPLITGILDEAELPHELIYLSMIESGLSSRAVSSVGAVGPWQFMPGTGKGYNLRNDWWVDERRDMEMSTRAACQHIEKLYAQFGDWALVLAAYNGGENRLARKIRQHGHDNFWEMRLPTQTTAYVPKFIAAAKIGQSPEKYGFETNEMKALAYDVIRVDDATDLELIADCAGVPANEVAKLNPALLRGATPPKSKGYPVKVPVGSGQTAMNKLKRIPADRRLTWRQHRVTRGETLGHIAGLYGTSVSDVAKLNNLRDVHLIRPGDQLLIPMPAELAAQARQRSAEKGHYVPPAGYRRVSYKVKSGDTLGKIAQKLGVTVKHLRKVNAIYKSHLIYPGQKLYAYRPGQG